MPKFVHGVAASVESLESRRLYAVNPAGFPFAAGATGFHTGFRTAPDAAGDVVVAGLFSGTTDFNPSRNKQTNLTARGNSDGFVAKYSVDGALIWVKQFGGDYSSKRAEDIEDRDPIINPRRLGQSVGRVGDQPRDLGEYVNDLVVGADGDIYVTGSFRKNASFGPVRGAVVNFTTADDDYHDAFVMRIDSAGQTEWVNQYGGRFDDAGMGIDVDAQGNAVVSGYFTRDANFGGTKSNYVLSAIGRDDAFVMRLSATGKLAWIVQAGGEAVSSDERDAANDVALDANGNVYVVGTYSDQADFAPGTGRLTLDAEGGTDAFTAFYSTRGKLVWAKSTGGDKADGNVAVAVGPAGDVYTAGYFEDEADVDPGPAELKFNAFDDNGEDDYTDVLVSRISTVGRLTWARQLGGPFYETIGDLKVDADGSAYVTGGYFQTVDLDPGTGVKAFSSTRTIDGDDIDDNNTRFNRQDSFDVYVSRLSARGKYLAAASYGGPLDDFGSGLAVLSGGQVALTGRFVRNARFGAASLSNAVDEAVFVAVTDGFFSVL